MYHTPMKRFQNSANEMASRTPLSFSKELKQVLAERNMLTVRSRNKVCSMLDIVTPNRNNDEVDKRKNFRLQAIQEIVDSEKTYLKQLELLMQYFIIPLKENSIIDDASHTTLFGQIEMIYNLNSELLKEIENNLENVAQAFLKMAPFIKLYSVYAFDYRNALFVLQDLTNKNPVFRKFIESNETRPEIQRKLNSLMIIPIQRVPRYKLLLEQVLMYTSPADADFKLLKESVKQVESTAAHINSVIEDQEVTQLLLNLQNSLINRTPNIVKPSRKVIKEGILHKVTRNGTEIKRYCVLMSDIFMYCKVLKERQPNTVVENSLECCCIFPLKKCKVYEMLPGSFKIACHGDGIMLGTKDLNLSRIWVGLIRDAVDLHIECRQTLRKESSKRKPLRKKAVKNFDTDYIVSPNKRKCDYETIFRNTNRSTDSEDDNVNKETSCFPSCSSNKRARTLKKNDISSGDVKVVTGILKTQPTSDYDPTYGFASRPNYAERYVDKLIKAPGSRGTFLHANNEADVKDILYPLRTSNGSEKSGKFRGCSKDNFNKPDIISGTSSNNRKRVMFDDTSDSCYSYKVEGNFSKQNQAPYPFSSFLIKNSHLSIKDRIVEFFTKLF